MAPRQELGTRTIFNILGPLTNPAAVRRQLTGAFSRDLIRPMAETLAELKDGCVTEFVVRPEDAGLAEGVALARRSIDSGAARARAERLAAVTTAEEATTPR